VAYKATRAERWAGAYLSSRKRKLLHLAKTASSVYDAGIELSELMVGEYTVVPLVEALRYKPEGRGFDWDFKLT